MEFTKEQFQTDLDAIGITAKQLSARTGIHVTTIYRWGRDGHYPQWMVLVLKLLRLNKRLMATRAQ